MIFVPFQPSPQQAFSFNATLDGNTYQMVVTWNVFGQRWYLSCYTANSGRVFTTALVGSPDTGDINLVGSWFVTNTMVFRQNTQQFEIGP